MTAEIFVSPNAGGVERTDVVGGMPVSGVGENKEGDAGRGLVSRIRESYETLTATERDAAQYILGHLTDVLVCNSVELSQLSGVSQPTLSRLYRKLGYANASEFRHDVRRVHQPGAPETARTEQCDDLLDDHLHRDEESLRHTFEGIDRGRLEYVCRSMAKASRIAVIGFRNSYPVALHLREQLLQLRGNVDILPHPGQSVAEEISDLSVQDVAVVVGVRRRPAFFASLVDALLERGVNVVVIGDVSVKSTLVGRNVTIFEVALNSHLLSSFTAAFAFVALLADEVGECLNETGEVSARIERINGYFSELSELEGC